MLKFHPLKSVGKIITVIITHSELLWAFSEHRPNVLAQGPAQSKPGIMLGKFILPLAYHVDVCFGIDVWTTEPL